MLELPPLSLYVHIPWCIRKCPYCDFNSHVTEALPEQDYLESLKHDLAGDAGFVQGRKLKSIFFGGGTPSLLSGSFYTELLNHIAGQIPFEDDIEISLEANPGAVEADRFAAYRMAGINRLSIGVQSFHEEQLQQLGRIHSGADAIAAVEAAKNAGFDNLNLDLMHGLPRQTPEDALDDLEQAMAFQPSHLSWYQLTIEPNTEYFRRPPVLPEDDDLWAIQESGMRLLETSGYRQYEISAYSKPGCRAHHNLNYWEFGDYIGIGAGAHSKVTNLDSKRIQRYRKTRMPNDYMQVRTDYRVGFAEPDARELSLEFMMNALRLNDGVSEGLFASRTGLQLQNLEPQLQQLRDKKLIAGNRLQASEQGRLFLNTLLEIFAGD